MGRTILFDIDKTLLSSGGAGGLAMRRAFHQLYGIEDGFQRVEFSGRTDWSILRRALEEHDLAAGGGDFAEEMARFQGAYFDMLAVTLRETSRGRTMPGVHELLDELAGRDDVRLGLATGNFRRSAFMKLRHFELDAHLSEGGFGDDAEDRGELVGKAIERLDGHTSDAVWVIGDTPLDVQAAHANGALALAVATGPCTVEELLEIGANAALDDLSDVAAVVDVLLG